jgi:hypothetical protein
MRATDVASDSRFREVTVSCREASTHRAGAGIALDYGRTDGAGRFGRRVSADVPERADGVLTFFGMVAATVGGPRQLAWAAGLALVANGVGLLFEPAGGSAHGWLAAGAFLIGCVVPAPRRRAAGGAACVAAACGESSPK